jgi:hypothetical protein
MNMTTKPLSENAQIFSATSELEIFDTRDLYLSRHNNSALSSQRSDNMAVGVDCDCIETD